MLYKSFKVGLNSKPRLISVDEILPNVEQDAYTSLYYYDDTAKKHFDEKGSLAGIKDVKTNTLLWDFDNVEDIELSRREAVILATRLVEQEQIHPDDIEVYFSGNKGFNVKVTLDHFITPDEFKAATNKLADGLTTFDPVVSDPNRIIRVENTKHPKSGLYKIPLHAYELDELSIEHIKELAKTKRRFVSAKAKPITLNEKYFKVEKAKAEPKIKQEVDLTNIPKNWKPYKWALAQGYFENGERHNALMVIAATCRGLGYDMNTTYYICKAALKNQAERYGVEEFDKKELWKNIIVDSVFSDKWEGGQYSPQNNPWLKKYCERMGFSTEDKEDELVQLHNIEEEFIDFVKNIDKNTIKTGIPVLDKALPLTVGMNLGIIGSASSGKTAISLKILKNTSDAGVVSVFASLDMRRNRLYEKLLYRVSGLSREQLYAKIANDEAKPIFDKVREEYKNVYFYDRSCPTVDDIRKYILNIEEKTGKKVKLVMVDYFERVNADKSEETAASKEVAGKLQDLVNDLNICLITLVQPNKFALSGGPDTPILNYTSIKGSSYLYQAFRSIISIWRPFFTPELKDHDKFLQMAILKNDLGELDMFNFSWEGRRGEITSLTEEGEDELASLLEMKENAKKAKDAEWE